MDEYSPSRHFEASSSKVASPQDQRGGVGSAQGRNEADYHTALGDTSGGTHTFTWKQSSKKGDKSGSPGGKRGDKGRKSSNSQQPHYWASSPVSVNAEPDQYQSRSSSTSSSNWWSGNKPGNSVPPPPPAAQRRHEPEAPPGSLSVLGHIKRGLQSWRDLSASQVVTIVLCMLMVIGGSTGQIISLNKWIAAFPSDEIHRATAAPPVSSGSVYSSSGSEVGSAGSSSLKDEAAKKIPHINVPFTILTLNSMFSTIVFAIVFLVYTGCYRRPVLGYRFMWSKKSAKFSSLLGFLLSVQAVLIVSATQATPEILQAFLLTTNILWTFLFVKVIMKDPRSYKNLMVVLSFMLSLVGVMLGAFGQLSTEEEDSDSGSSKYSTMDVIYWSVLFAVASIPTALFNVAASFYMRALAVSDDLVHKLHVFFAQQQEGEQRDNTLFLADDGSQGDGRFRGPTDGIDEPLVNDKEVVVKTKVKRSTLEDSPPNTPSDKPGRKKVEVEQEQVVDFDFVVNLKNNDCNGGADETTTKLAMLVLSSLWTTIFIWLMVPTGAIPWFGGSPSVAHLTSDIMHGWRCSLGIGAGCDGVPIFFFLFLTMFLLGNAGIAMLNYYSPGLCTILQQLASPFTALILLIVPALNVTHEPIGIPETVCAVIFTAAGSLCYCAWEESTKDQIEQLNQEKEAEKTRLQHGNTLGGSPKSSARSSVLNSRDSRVTSEGDEFYHGADSTLSSRSMHSLGDY